jgi:hypothetical protein
MSKSLLCAMLLALLALPDVLSAQAAQGDAAAREREFIETLRRENPASAERFMALRNASDQALAELRRREKEVNAMPTTELRGPLLPPLKEAQRKYVDSQFKILDFLDERDRGIIKSLQEETAQFKHALDERQRSREELKKLLPAE